MTFCSPCVSLFLTTLFSSPCSFFLQLSRPILFWSPTNYFYSIFQEASEKEIFPQTLHVFGDNFGDNFGNNFWDNLMTVSGTISWTFLGTLSVQSPSSVFLQLPYPILIPNKIFFNSIFQEVSDRVDNIEPIFVDDIKVEDEDNKVEDPKKQDTKSAQKFDVDPRIKKLGESC